PEALLLPVEEAYLVAERLARLAEDAELETGTVRTAGSCLAGCCAVGEHARARRARPIEQGAPDAEAQEQELGCTESRSALRGERDPRAIAPGVVPHRPVGGEQALQKPDHRISRSREEALGNALLLSRPRYHTEGLEELHEEFPMVREMPHAS